MIASRQSATFGEAGNPKAVIKAGMGGSALSGRAFLRRTTHSVAPIARSITAYKSSVAFSLDKRAMAPASNIAST